jgi:hypothetical protein
MVKRLPPGKDHSRSGAPDDDTIQGLQRKYSQARLASGDMPAEIVRKIARMRKLDAKLYGGPKPAGKDDGQEAARLVKLAIELLPHLNFRVDDVDWYAPDVEILLAQGVLPKRGMSRASELTSCRARAGGRGCRHRS